MLVVERVGGADATHKIETGAGEERDDVFGVGEAECESIGDVAGGGASAGFIEHEGGIVDAQGAEGRGEALAEADEEFGLAAGDVESGRERRSSGECVGFVDEVEGVLDGGGGDGVAVGVRSVGEGGEAGTVHAGRVLGKKL